MSELPRVAEFSEALERFRDVQKNNPFKTGTEEHTYVNSMMIALLLFEKKIDIISQTVSKVIPK